MKTPVFYMACVTVVLTSFTTSQANPATEIFECSELAEWAGFDQEAYDLARLGYARAHEEASEFLARLRQEKNPTPSFTSERSADFWAGMWMGRSILAVSEWLQGQHPLKSREGAGTTERIMISRRQQEVWKPIAGSEYRQRGCDFYLPKKRG